MIAFLVNIMFVAKRRRRADLFVKRSYDVTLKERLLRSKITLTLTATGWWMRKQLHLSLRLDLAFLDL